MKELVIFGAFLPAVVLLGGIWLLAVSVLYVREEILA